MGASRGGEPCSRRAQNLATRYWLWPWPGIARFCCPLLLDNHPFWTGIAQICSDQDTGHPPGASTKRGELVVAAFCTCWAIAPNRGEMAARDALSIAANCRRLAYR